MEIYRPFGVILQVVLNNLISLHVMKGFPEVIKSLDFTGMKLGMSPSELSSSSGGSSCKRVIKCSLKIRAKFPSNLDQLYGGTSFVLLGRFCFSANMCNQNLMAFDRARFRVVSVSSVSNASRVRRLNGTQVPPSRCQSLSPWRGGLLPLWRADIGWTVLQQRRPGQEC